MAEDSKEQSYRKALNQIGYGFASPEQLRKDARKVYGLPYEEVLEMAYENMQQTARMALSGAPRKKGRTTKKGSQDDQTCTCPH